jgi:hypothetical protein
VSDTDDQVAWATTRFRRAQTRADRHRPLSQGPSLIRDLAERGNYRPVIDLSYALDKAVDATATWRPVRRQEVSSSASMRPYVSDGRADEGRSSASVRRS